MTLKTGLGQGHWKYHHSIQRIWLPIDVRYQLWLYLVSFLRYPVSNNIVTLNSRSKVTQGYWKWCHSIDWVFFLLVLYSNFVPKTHRFGIFDFKKCRDLEGNPFSGGAKYTGGWEKLVIFDGNRRLSRKWCETGRWLLWNVNRKSWVPDWKVSSSMALSDP